MGAIRRGIRSARAGVAALADLALAGECAGCSESLASGHGGGDGSGGGGLCPACAAVLAGRPFPVRVIRGRSHLPVVYALSRYQEPLSGVIIAQKEHGRLDLARPLGRGLAAVIEAALVDDALDPAPGDPTPLSDTPRVLLIPVPSAKAAERRRGQDPVLRMARVAAARLRHRGLRTEVLRALRHNRAVADQVGLSRAARAANLAGSMGATATGRRVLSSGPLVAVLLDDVYTSGATLTEAARAVRAVPGFRDSGGRLVAAVLAGPTR
jgi:predicted amidophosphoribosyltransferase